MINRHSKSEQCNFRTYTNANVADHVRSRFDSSQPARVAIVPFEVPETFADQWDGKGDFGRELGRRFQAELYKTGEFGIIELFDRDRWPGKQSEFFGGNYQAIKLAREAGYDVVVLGYLEPPTNASELNLYTKIIDTRNNVTIWYGMSQVSSTARAQLSLTSKLGLTKDRPEKFYFPERIEYLTSCTVDEMLKSDPVP